MITHHTHRNNDMSVWHHNGPYYNIIKVIMTLYVLVKLMLQLGLSLHHAIKDKINPKIHVVIFSHITWTAWNDILQTPLILSHVCNLYYFMYK